jgi:hypothetical protein
MRNRVKGSVMIKWKFYIMIMLGMVLLDIYPAKAGGLKLIDENGRFQVVFPDGRKAFIIGEYPGGSNNTAVLSPDSKYVFYTDATGIGFESSGKDMFYCKPDGTERTFLHKINGGASKVQWIRKKLHNYLLFLEVLAEAGEASIDLFDFDNRKMLLKIEGWVLEPTKRADCFVIGKEEGKPREWSTIWLDSLLSMSNPDKYNVQIYEGYGFHNELYLSTRKEPFLNPDYYWMDVPRYNNSEYGGIGMSSPSRYKNRTVFCSNMDSRSWIGVLNNKTNLFQFSDSMTTGEYKYNFAWSYKDDLLGFVKRYPDNSQEIVVLEFLGDSSYTIRDQVKFTKEKDVELIGWSILKGGFEYMNGEKELLKIQK